MLDLCNTQSSFVPNFHLLIHTRNNNSFNVESLNRCCCLLFLRVLPYFNENRTVESRKLVYHLIKKHL